MTSLWRLCTNNLPQKISSNLCGSVRNGHHIRGKAPGVARNLEQRLAELNWKDPEVHSRVDIGLPANSFNKKQLLKEHMGKLRDNWKNSELEKLSRHRKLRIDLDKAHKEWESTYGQSQIKDIADHFGIFEHLYGYGYFNPRVPLTILYDYNSEQQLPVYYGNVIKPADAAKKPTVHFDSDKDSLWTLILTNPDGHLTEQESEYVHWFVGNIPGNNVNAGETIVDYLQPFPPKGTGYHRLVFVLYKQEKRIDYADFKREAPCINLNERTFKTFDFYGKHEDLITPAGLAFFQSDWDKSLKNFYHKTLGMKEPIYEYDFPPPYLRPQEWFPLRKPFNVYMDKYRDQKQINKEFLVRKLKHVHPFKPDPKPLPYPNAAYFEKDHPSWLKLEMEKSRLKWGRINEIE